MSDKMWLVHRETGQRVLLAKHSGGGLWDAKGWVIDPLGDRLNHEFHNCFGEARGWYVEYDSDPYYAERLRKKIESD